MILRVLAFFAGLILVGFTVFSAIRTFVLPRSANDPLTRIVFRNMRRVFNLVVNRQKTFRNRDRTMAFFAPFSLISLPAAWLVLVLIGYMGMFWACGVETFRGAFTLSGSSLLTLGFASVSDWPTTLLAFSEAAIGLFLVALLISYLPTMYSAFQRREQVVTLLEVRAGSPPSPVEMLIRAHRIRGLESLQEQWFNWEVWFTDIEESHTSLAALTFYRSPQPHRHWIVAAGTILDSAALLASTVDVPRTPGPELCIRAGYLALRQVADFFKIAYNANPQYGDPIKLSREQFDAACDQLAGVGLPLKPDREKAWQDFAGWRVNYEMVLLTMAAVTMAPGAPWLPEQHSILPRIASNRQRDKK